MALRNLKPDFARLKLLPIRGLIVTCLDETGKYDFLSRFFAPAFGIDEDPVTGSAHCALGPYWSAELGKNSLRAFQASARGGEINVTVGGERITLAGQAVLVMRGTLVDSASQ